MTIPTMDRGRSARGEVRRCRMTEQASERGYRCIASQLYTPRTMYLAQQLSPLVRRIRVVRPDAPDQDRLPDPAIGDWGRQRLAAEPIEQHETLEAALG